VVAFTFMKTRVDSARNDKMNINVSSFVFFMVTLLLD